MSRLKFEDGQSMVEFAIALMFLVMFLIGIMEFSWLMGNKLLATHASREGARYASVHTGDSDLNANTVLIVEEALVIDAKSFPGYAITITPKSDASLGDRIEVSISYSIPHLTGLIPSAVVANPFPINAKTTMKSE